MPDTLLPLPHSPIYLYLKISKNSEITLKSLPGESLFVSPDQMLKCMIPEASLPLGCSKFYQSCAEDLSEGRGWDGGGSAS